jgi:hypothetical protein
MSKLLTGPLAPWHAALDITVNNLKCPPRRKLAPGKPERLLKAQAVTAGYPAWTPSESQQ